MVMFKQIHRYMTVEITEVDRAFFINVWFTVMDTWLLENEVYPNAYTEPTPDAIWHVKSNIELTVGLLEYVVARAEELMDRSDAKNRIRPVVNRK